MYKKCKTKEAASRQQSFEYCLLESMSHVPYDKISITDLCAKVGIARKNFYRYFDTKEDVLLALIDHTILRYQHYNLTELDETNEMHNELVRFLSYWESQKTLLDALEKNHLSSKIIERTLVYVWEEDYGYQKMLNTTDNSDISNMIMFTVSGLMSLILNWHHNNYKEPREQFATTILQMLHKPLFHI